MYHIAVCDDDGIFREYIIKIINLAKDDEEIKIYEFSSGEELLRNLDNKYYDLLILDKQLGGIDGDETARQFRKKFPNTILVFCSGIFFPTVKSFRATPFRYILKSDSQMELVSEMKEILREVKRNLYEEFIAGHYRNSTIKVRIKNILYIENAKRGSRVIVDSKSEEAKFKEQILVREKLGEISNRFSNLVFAHRSYIVNINRVKYVIKNELVLDTEERLSISRAYQKSFREAHIESMMNRY